MVHFLNYFLIVMENVTYSECVLTGIMHKNRKLIVQFAKWKTYQFLRRFRFLPWCKQDLHSSGILCSVDW
jgi:hypothetical protein